MERDPTSVLLATIATAGALTLSDVLIRWASSARDLYRGLKKLREADAIEIRGDSAEVDQLMQELKKISATESDDTAESARDLISYVKEHEEMLRTIEVAPSTTGYRKASREFAL